MIASLTFSVSPSWNPPRNPPRIHWRRKGILDTLCSVMHQLFTTAVVITFINLFLEPPSIHPSVFSCYQRQQRQTRKVP